MLAFEKYTGCMSSTQLKHDPGIVQYDSGRRFAGGDRSLRIEPPGWNAR
jgi:hypothetical protein